MADVRELGGKVWHGPFSAPGVGRIAMLADPQGAGSSVITLEQAVSPRGRFVRAPESRAAVLPCT